MTDTPGKDLDGIAGALTLLLADLSDDDVAKLFRQVTNSRMLFLNTQQTKSLGQIGNLLREVTDSLGGGSGIGAIAAKNLHVTAKVALDKLELILK